VQSTMGRPVSLWISPRVLYGDTTMTAIGVVQTEAGFVIVADGRMIIDDETRRATTPAAILEKESEEAQKIFPIIDKEKALAYASAGSVTIGDFNVVEVLKRKMASLSNRNFATCKQYFEAVAEKFADATHCGPWPCHPPKRRLGPTANGPVSPMESSEQGRDGQGSWPTTWDFAEG